MNKIEQAKSRHKNMRIKVSIVVVIRCTRESLSELLEGCAKE